MAGQRREYVAIATMGDASTVTTTTATSPFDIRLEPFRLATVLINGMGLVGNVAIVAAISRRGSSLRCTSSAVIALLALNDLCSNVGGFMVCSLHVVQAIDWSCLRLLTTWGGPR